MSVRLEIAEVVVSRGPITNQFLDWMRSTERPILGGLARMAGVVFFLCWTAADFGRFAAWMMERCCPSA